MTRRKNIWLILSASFLLSVTFLLLRGNGSRPDGHDLYNNPIYLNRYAGKKIIIHYWASWCSSCQEEIPVLNQLYRTRTNKVMIFGINYDELPVDQLKILVSQLSLQFPQLLDLSTRSLPSISVLPTSMVLSETGELERVVVGPQSETAWIKILHLSHDSERP